MSVSLAQNLFQCNKKSQSYSHPHEELLKNILSRLDTLQSNQMKPYMKTYNPSNSHSDTDLDRIKQNMKTVVNANIQNLKRLQENMRENWEELYERVRGFENKMMRNLKDKEQAMEYMDYRVSNVENSQRTVSDFMKKLVEQENEKYLGVSLLEDRLKQMQRIFELKTQTINESIKIGQEKTKIDMQRRLKDIEEMGQSLKKENKGQNKMGNLQLQQMKDKINMLEIDLKDQKRKHIKLQQKTQQLQEQFEKISKKIIEINSNNSTKQRNSVASVKTHNYEPDWQQKNKREIFPKKTQPSSYLKPSGSKPELRKGNNVYDIMEGEKERKPISALQQRYKQKQARQSEQRNTKKTIQYSEQDADPFENMVGGIRGLLKKSKQKQKRQVIQQPKKPLPPTNKLRQVSTPSLNNPISLNRNLPPVKADLKRQNNIISQTNLEEELEQQEEVYRIDEEGYLIDEEGNYLYDEYGNRVQLSQQQMYELQQQGQN